MLHLIDIIVYVIMLLFKLFCRDKIRVQTFELLMFTTQA